MPQQTGDCEVMLLLQVTDLRRQMAERTQRLNEVQAAAEAARKEAARVRNSHISTVHPSIRHGTPGI